MKKFTLQHVGYPTTAALTEDMWKDLSKHSSALAAYKAYSKRVAHLDYGSWDDHYRILDPDGKMVDIEEIKMGIYYKNAMRELKSIK